MSGLKIYGVLLVSWIAFGATTIIASEDSQKEANAEILLSDYDWWREARFGVFIHWGPASLLELGKGSWQRQDRNSARGFNRMEPEIPDSIKSKDYKKYINSELRENRVPTEIYDNLFHDFNPVEFDAKRWVEAIKGAGASYIVFVTKHHDGFAMFDSSKTDYDIMNTPFARDLCKELSDACHEMGIKVIWYYSVADWFHPVYNEKNAAAYVDFMSEQVRELSTNYGEVAGFWWDRDRISIDAVDLFEIIRSYQPRAISNDRIKGVAPRHNVPGVAYHTPENRIGDFSMEVPWESCVTIFPHNFWFWNGDHGCRTIEFTIASLVYCAVGDGNLLLDIGPNDRGSIPADVLDNFEQMGDWLSRYGESIYGTRGGPYKPGVWGGSTRNGRDVYLHIMQRWPNGQMSLPPLPYEIISAEVLTGGNVLVSQTKSGLMIKMNPEDIDPLNTIVKLRINGNAMSIDPIETKPFESLTFDAAVSASSSISKGYLPEAVVGHSWDRKGLFTAAPGERGGSMGAASIVPVPKGMEDIAKYELNSRRRFWEASPNDESPWLHLKLRQKETFDRIQIRECAGSVRGFRIEYRDEGKWLLLHEGTSLEMFSMQLPHEVTSQEVRLVFTDFIDAPSIHTFHLYSPSDGR